MSKVLIFRRVDGVIGVGFQIEFGGVEQYSIAWPDRAPERLSIDPAEKMGIVDEVAPIDRMEPSELLVNFGKTENPPPFTSTPEHPEPPVVVEPLSWHDEPSRNDSTVADDVSGTSVEIAPVESKPTV